MRRFLMTALLLWTACSDEEEKKPPQAPPVSVARRITEATRANDVFGGPDAMGGVGDFYLANDKIEAVIDDTANQNVAHGSGGTLIDLGLRGQHNDQWNQLWSVLALAQTLPFYYTEISASVPEGDTAAVRVKGHVAVQDPRHALAAVGDKIEIVTEYSVRAGEDFLRLKTTLINRTGAPLLAGGAGNVITDVLFWGGRSTKPFASFPGRGFVHPTLNVLDPLPAIGHFPFVTGKGVSHPPVSVSYLAPALPDALVVGVNDDQVSAVGMGLKPGVALEDGGALEFERMIVVGGRNDVASSADRAWELRAAAAPADAPGTVSGRVVGVRAEDAPETSVVLYRPGTPETPLNETSVAADGSFSMKGPPGNAKVRATVPGYAPLLAGPVTIASGQTVSAPDLTLPAVRRVGFTIKNAATGQPMPGKVTVKGREGTPDPNFGIRLAFARSWNVAYTEDGTAEVFLPPGKYDLYFSRGMEWQLAKEPVDLTAEGADVVATLERILPTAGWISTDLHVHAQPSFDTQVPLDVRVVSYAGEGVEIVASTDHDYIADYGPAIESVGLSGELKSMVGIESTASVPWSGAPNTIGHYNAYPVRLGIGLPRNGAPPDEFIQPGELFERLRALEPEPGLVPHVHLCHPRSRGTGVVGYGYFTNFKLRPNVPVPATDTGPNGFLRRGSPSGTGNLSFEAIELLNGTGYPEYQMNRVDWFSLLNQGFARTGLGNSDSHAIVLEEAGVPRNYVEMPSDVLADFDQRTLLQRIREMKVVVSSGPFVKLTVTSGGASVGPGETIAAAGGQASVRAQVWSAPWLPLSEVRFVVNGTVVKTDAVTDPAPDPYGVQLWTADVTHPLSLAKDSWVLVEAGAALLQTADTDSDGSPDTWDANSDGAITAADKTLNRGVRWPEPPPLSHLVAPHNVPYAFTNPVFVDADGGGYTPPGLP